MFASLCKQDMSNWHQCSICQKSSGGSTTGERKALRHSWHYVLIQWGC